MALRVSFSKTYPLGQTGLNNFGAQISNILFTMFNFEQFLCLRLPPEGAKISNSNEISSKFSRGNGAPKSRKSVGFVIHFDHKFGRGGGNPPEGRIFFQTKKLPSGEK